MRALIDSELHRLEEFLLIPDAQESESLASLVAADYREVSDTGHLQVGAASALWRFENGWQVVLRQRPEVPACGD